MASFNINSDIKKSKTLPSKFYLEKEYLNFCKEVLFADSWQFVITVNQLKKNNIYPFTFLENFIDEPLVLLAEKSSILCFTNVCTHRAHLLATEPCNNNILRCNYHGRQFSFDGNFKSMPGFKKTKNFPTEEDNLLSLPTITWNDFIFVSLTGKINITSVLEDIKNRLPNFPYDQLNYDKNVSKFWNLDAHWALYCENYLEGLHVPFVHKGLAKEININTYKTVLLDNAVLQIAEGETNNNVLQNQDNDKNIYALYYWIFPNCMLNFYSWGMSINIIEPVSLNKTRIRFLSFPLNNYEQPDQGSASLEQIEMEDQQVVLNVQKGIQSRFYTSGRYSPNYEKGVHHFHLLLNKYLGKTKTLK